MKVLAFLVLTLYAHSATADPMGDGRWIVASGGYVEAMTCNPCKPGSVTSFSGNLIRYDWSTDTSSWFFLDSAQFTMPELAAPMTTVFIEMPYTFEAHQFTYPGPHHYQSGGGVAIGEFFVGGHEPYLWHVRDVNYRATGSLAEPAPVPEPASMLLLGTGLVGVGVRRWRRNGA